MVSTIVTKEVSYRFCRLQSVYAGSLEDADRLDSAKRGVKCPSLMKVNVRNILERKKETCFRTHLTINNMSIKYVQNHLTNQKVKIVF